MSVWVKKYRFVGVHTMNELHFSSTAAISRKNHSISWPILFTGQYSASEQCWQTLIVSSSKLYTGIISNNLRETGSPPLPAPPKSVSVHSLSLATYELARSSSAFGVCAQALFWAINESSASIGDYEGWQVENRESRLLHCANTRSRHRLQTIVRTLPSDGACCTSRVKL